MAFKNLEERLIAREKEIYGKLSARQGSDGVLTSEPYLEFKPNDKNLPELQNDTRMVPGKAYELDKQRIDAFLKSGKGQLWLNNQINLQKKNVVSQTRTYDKKSLITALEPNKFPVRSTLTPDEEKIDGNIGNMSYLSVGKAGRLQLSTSKKSILSVATSNDPALRASKELNTALSFAGIKNDSIVGSLNVDQRPEFDINGKGTYDSLYSVAMWQGYLKIGSGPLESSFKKLGNSIKNIHPKGVLTSVGKISGNVSSIAGSIQNNANRIIGFTNSLSTFISNVSNPTARRERGVVGLIGDGFGLLNRGKSIKFGLDNTERPEGLRYFITGIDKADRYLPGTIDFDGEKPQPSLSFMNRPASIYDADIKTAETTTVRLQKPETPQEIPELTATATRLGGILGIIQRGATWVSNIAGKITKFTNTVSSAVNQIEKISYEGIENPAEDAMKFSGESLRQRYHTDDRLAFFRDQLKAQKERWLQSIQDANGINSLQAGYGGGITLGTEIIPRTKSKYKFSDVPVDENGNRRYFNDPVNILPIFSEEGDGVSLSRLTDGTTGLINFYFFDQVNKKTIPFRAYINGFNQSVTPSYTELPYIGRPERNIVYSGFKRDISFTMKVYAFNRDELDSIWQKINYLTSLTTPSTYDPNGFMVPPLVKLTLGSVFVNQPGYLKSLTVTIDDDTTWEVDYDRQLPLGLTIQIGYSIIETHQMRAGEYSPGRGHSVSRFYAPQMGSEVIPINTSNSSRETSITSGNDIGEDSSSDDGPVDRVIPNDHISFDKREAEERLRESLTSQVNRIINKIGF